MASRTGEKEDSIAKFMYQWRPDQSKYVFVVAFSGTDLTDRWDLIDDANIATFIEVPL